VLVKEEESVCSTLHVKELTGKDENLLLPILKKEIFGY